MKYIRTTEDIFQFEKTIELFRIESCRYIYITLYKNGHSSISIDEDNQKNIIKKAEKLELLFDEIMFIDEKGQQHFENKEGSLWHLGSLLFAKTLRGGIYVNGVFKLVAEKNEKGNWELL